MWFCWNQLCTSKYCIVLSLYVKFLFLLGVVMLKFRSFLVLGLFGISISVASCGGGTKANNNQTQKPADVPDRTVLPDDSRINTVLDQDSFVCAHDLNVRNSYLELIPNAKTVYGEKVKKTGEKKSKWLNGSNITFVRVKFLSDSAHGWLAEKYIKTGSCDGKSSSPNTTYSNPESIRNLQQRINQVIVLYL